MTGVSRCRCPYCAVRKFLPLLSARRLRHPFCWKAGIRSSTRNPKMRRSRNLVVRLKVQHPLLCQLPHFVVRGRHAGLDVLGERAFDPVVKCAFGGAPIQSVVCCPPLLGVRLRHLLVPKSRYAISHFFRKFRPNMVIVELWVRNRLTLQLLYRALNRAEKPVAALGLDDAKTPVTKERRQCGPECLLDGTTPGELLEVQLLQWRAWHWVLRGQTLHRAAQGEGLLRVDAAAGALHVEDAAHQRVEALLLLRSGQHVLAGDLRLQPRRIGERLAQQCLERSCFGVW